MFITKIIEVIIGEVIAAGTVIVIGSLHYANIIHKRLTATDNTAGINMTNSPPKDGDYVIFSKNDTSKEISDDERLKLLVEERSFIIGRISIAWAKEKELYIDRCTEIAREIININERKLINK